jgi:hypothetical protein
MEYAASILRVLSNTLQMEAAVSFKVSLNSYQITWLQISDGSRLCLMIWRKKKIGSFVMKFLGTAEYVWATRVVELFKSSDRPTIETYIP